MYQGLQKARNSRFIYVDFNSFFASVEQQHSPSLVDKPIAVITHPGPSGTVLAASYEAKALGVKTGSRLREAFERCPQLITRPTNPSLYRSVHKRFVHILRDMTGPEVKVWSIDEAAIPLAPNWQGSEQAWSIATAIKARFRRELGQHIRCSVGIAPNSLLAKVATDLKKPDGLVEITLENTPEVLSTLKLTDLPGVANRQAAHLIARGITTPLQFYQADPGILRQCFGAWGQYWYWHLHGYEAGSKDALLKTMSHQHVLKEWRSSVNSVEPVILKMSDRLIYRLRHNQFQCRSVWIYLSLKNHPGLMAERRFDAPTNSYHSLLNALKEMSGGFPKVLPAPIRKVSLGFGSLVQSVSGLQLDLFNVTSRQESMTEALYSVRTRFGYEAIQLGSTYRLHKGEAKEELGFGHLKDQTTHP